MLNSATIGDIKRDRERNRANIWAALSDGRAKLKRQSGLVMNSGGGGGGGGGSNGGNPGPVSGLALIR